MAHSPEQPAFDVADVRSMDSNHHSLKITSGNMMIPPLTPLLESPQAALWYDHNSSGDSNSNYSSRPHTGGYETGTGDRFIAAVQPSAFGMGMFGGSPQLPGVSDGGIFPTPDVADDTSQDVYSRTLREQLHIGGNVMRYSSTPPPGAPNRFSIGAAGPGVSPTNGARTQLWDTSLLDNSPQEASPGEECDGYSSATVTPRKSSTLALGLPPRTPPQAGLHTRTPLSTPPPSARGGQSPMQTPRAFRTPVLEDSNPAGATSTPSMSPFQSPGRGTPSSSRRRRRPMAENVSPARILNANGILADCGTHVLCWSGSVLWIALENTVYAWTPTSMGVLETVRESAITALHASPVIGGSVFVAIGTENGLIHVIEVSATSVRPPTPQANSHSRRSATPSTTPPPQLTPHKIRQYIINEHTSRISALQVNRNRIASTSLGGLLIINDVHSTHVQYRVTLPCSIYDLDFSRDGTHLALGTDTGLQVFDMTQLAEPTVYATSAPVRCLRWSPHGLLSLLAFSVGNSIHFFSPGAGEKGGINLKANVVSMAWSQSTTDLVVGHGQATLESQKNIDYFIGVYDASQVPNYGGSKLHLANQITGHRAAAFHIAVSPDATTVVTGAGDTDGTLRFWQLFPSLNTDSQLSLEAALGHGGSFYNNVGSSSVFGRSPASYSRGDDLR